jgi:hypothetical protein
MKQFTFAKDAALKIGNDFLSDHNRQPLALGYERIENKVRTQNGLLRKYHIADKVTITANWEMLPETNAQTIDYGLGAKDIEQLYLESTGVVEVTVTFGNEDTATYSMVFGEFQIELVKRWNDVNMYNVSVLLEEV